MDARSACQSPVLEPYVWMHGVLVSEGCLFSLCFFRRVQYQFYFAFLCTFSNEWSLISVTFVNVSELSARAQGGSDRRPSPPSGDCYRRAHWQYRSISRPSALCVCSIGSISLA